MKHQQTNFQIQLWRFSIYLKETAKDSVNPDELKYILDTIQSDSINFKLLGDILVDDRKELSLGRKILDQSRLGIPWILIVKVLINS